MQRLIVSLCSLTIVWVALALSPQSLVGQDICILRCFMPGCGETQHKAYQQEDLDEWDGGYHEETCYDKPCCWIASGGDCKHPACGMQHVAQNPQAGDDASVVPVLEELKQALARSDMPAVAEVLQTDGRFVVNEERRAIQLVSPCTEDAEFIVAHANLPIAFRDLADLRRLIPVE